MKCVRCGHCCFAYDVIIVKPEHVDTFNPDTIDELDVKNPQEILSHKKSGEICPHFNYDYDTMTSTCKIHDKWWFEESPCGQFTQIGHANDNCRMGSAIKNGRVPNIFSHPDVKSKLISDEK